MKKVRMTELDIILMRSTLAAAVKMLGVDSSNHSAGDRLDWKDFTITVKLTPHPLVRHIVIEGEMRLMRGIRNPQYIGVKAKRIDLVAGYRMENRRKERVWEATSLSVTVTAGAELLAPTMSFSVDRFGQLTK